MSEPRSVEELLRVGVRVLEDSSALFEDHDHVSEAKQLLGSALRATDEEVEALPDDHEPSLRMRERYLSYVARRAGGEPQPFIRGSIEFFGLDLKVRPGSFVPRPSSELTVERAIRRLRRRKKPVVVDVCTGAGPIALAIADELPNAEVWGTDIHAEGLSLGRENARLLDIRNVHFRKGDMFGALPDELRGRVDLVTGHVPYVPKGELDDLPAEVKEHEPLFTLTDDSEDGMGLIWRALQEGPEWTKPGGWILLEMSDDTAREVTRLCRQTDLEEVSVASDDDGLSVVVEARIPRAGKGAR
jgi:release factor glutamine methyltransferase